MSDLGSGRPTIKFIHAGPVSRLDKVIAERLEQLGESQRISRSQVKNAIEKGLVSVNGSVVTKAGTAVQCASAIVMGFVRDDSADELVPMESDLVILYEDEELIVIDKPPGLTMHPGAGNRTNTLANILVHHWGQGSSALRTKLPRAGIVHRLDKDTTGVVVVAKTLPAHEKLSRQFADRSVGRAYRALAQISPRSALFTSRAGGNSVVHDDREFVCGVIDAPLGRHPKHRTKMAVASVGGRRAVTNWSLLDRFEHGAYLELKLETGRTHQIRVHLAHYGAPVVGDTTYGRDSALPHKLRIAAESFGRQALHAFRLEFTHPTTRERLSFESPVPTDMQRLVAFFGAR